MAHKKLESQPVHYVSYFLSFQSIIGPADFKLSHKCVFVGRGFSRDIKARKYRALSPWTAIHLASKTTYEMSG
jgi:hypothetical protein